MRQSRFTDEQIVGVLHKWDAGANVVDVVRTHGVTEQTRYGESEYGGMQASEAKRLKTLEEENQQLRRLVADHALNLQVVRDPLEKCDELRATADGRHPGHGFRGLSERRACRFTGFSRSTQRYATRRDHDTALRERLHTLERLRPAGAIAAYIACYAVRASM